MESEGEEEEEWQCSEASNLLSEASQEVEERSAKERILCRVGKYLDLLHKQELPHGFKYQRHTLQGPCLCQFAH